MNPLLARLATVRRRYRTVAVASGLFAAAAFVGGALVAVSAADASVHLPRFLRAAALVGILSGAAALILQTLIVPLLRRSDNLSLALRIEEQHPELNDALASTVQFLEDPDSPLAGDAKLRAKAMEKAEIQARSFDFFKIIDYRFLGGAALALAVVVGLGWHFARSEPELSRVGALRVLDPFGHHPWTDIAVPEAQTRLAVGQPFRIKANVNGVVPSHLKFEVQAQNPFNKRFEARPDVVVPVKIASSQARQGTVAVGLDVSQKPLKFRYRITGNDGAFPPSLGSWHEVDVLQPPSFAMLDGQPSPQITLSIPAYTGLPSPLPLSPGTRHLELVQGTTVDFRAAVDRPLKSATIELKPNDPSARLFAAAGFVAAPALLPQMAPTAALAAFPWRVEATLDESRQKLSATFRPLLPGSYVLRLVDDDDLIRDYEADLRVLADPVPVATLREPASNQTCLVTAEVAFRVLAEDDFFAVKSVALEYRRKDAKGEWVDAAATRVVLHDSAANPDGKARLKRVEAATTLAIKKLFKVGDVVAVQAVADDFCDVFAFRPSGRSVQIELRIVAPEELARQMDEALADVQKEILVAKKVQDEAQDLLDKLPKDKADAKALDQLIEASQKAREVQERIGAKSTEGIRDKLAKMQQTIRDNKLPESELKDQVRGLRQELDRLVQEEFPKLEQNLNDARKEMAGVSKQKDAKDSKSPLDKAKESSKEVGKTLNELARTLDRWADLAQIKGQTRELIEKQKTVSEETEKTRAEADKLRESGIDDKQIRGALKGDRDRVAGQQKKVEQETKDLLDRIAKTRQRQDDVARAEGEKAEEGDKDAKDRADVAKDTSQKLRKAQGTASTEGLKDDLRQATRELDEGNPNAALDQQKKATQTMQKMLADLEGKRDDDLDRLRKKQKDVAAAQNDLDKLGRKMQKQHDAAAKPNAKVDPKQRAQEMRDDAEDLREKARQLQRLQEPRAARELQQAADILDKAAKQVEAGENADDLEAEAQQRVEQAMEQLEHLRQELAREHLARVADRLKGLKERQDAAVERTRELQTKVENRKQWSRGLIDTLEADRKSQEGLAKEAQSLEEKLKGALVFEHILKKAGKSMEQAADAMGERKESARERQLAPFEKEELADEVRRHEDVLRLQKQAADRLDRMLESMKDPPQMAKAEPKKREPMPKDGMEEPKEKEPMGGFQAQDGIPPSAQIRALKGEQVELYERTKEFSRRHPNPAQLDEPRLRELRELTDEQGRLRQLFEQMTAPREEKMP